VAAPIANGADTGTSPIVFTPEELDRRAFVPPVA